MAAKNPDPFAGFVPWSQNRSPLGPAAQPAAARFSFVTVMAGRDPIYEVRRGGIAGERLGTVAQVGDCWQAKALTAGGKLRAKAFRDRAAAAEWLLAWKEAAS